VNEPPIAAILASNQQVLTRELVTLSGEASSDPDGEIVSYAWDLDGDNEFDDASGRDASVAFLEAGSYTIGLRVTDTNGESGIAELALMARPNVRVEGSTLVYEAAPGDANAISIDQGEDGFRVSDTVGSIGRGDGCVASDEDALCNGEISYVRVDAGDGSDRVALDVAVPTEITGGAGDDELVGGTAADIVTGDEGDDVLAGRGDHDVLRGGEGKDHESGGWGADMLFEAAALNGADFLDGGPGQDTVSYSERTAPLVVTLGGRADDGEAGELDDVTSVERVLGGSGADLVVGTANREALRGRGGADELRGSVGRDTLFGGPGGDVLKGGIDGRRDLLRGGGGNDWARVERVDRTYSVERVDVAR
jgi:Ca2+-binding RTX toxin-like protein